MRLIILIILLLLCPFLAFADDIFIDSHNPSKISIRKTVVQVLPTTSIEQMEKQKQMMLDRATDLQNQIDFAKAHGAKTVKEYNDEQVARMIAEKEAQEQAAQNAATNEEVNP